MRRPAMAAIPAVCLLLAADVARAQRGVGDWMTSAFDAQRSSWVRNDVKISRESLQKPGFELVWQLKLNDMPRQLNSITAPALLDFFIGHRGFRTLGFFGRSGGSIIAIDTDLARTEWEKSLSDPPPAGTPDCPGGMTSAVTRPTTTGYPPPPTGRGFGRGTPAKSGVGLPHEGAVTIRNTPAPRPAAPQPGSKRGARTEAAPNPCAPHVQWLLSLTGDGKLHSMWVSNGHEPEPAVQFIPPNARAHGLVAFGGTAYVATSGGCGGVASGVWALDLTSRKVASWKSAGDDLGGTAGPAAAPDGTLYVAGGGGELTALAPGSLQPRGIYKTGGSAFTSSPVVFDFNGKDLIAVTTGDGRLHLLAADALASPLDKSEPFAIPGYDSGALTSWQDPAGTRWILVAAGANVAAWKVVDRNGRPGLQRGWTSRDLVSPLPPIVVNGVVFALSSGELRDPKLPAAERARRSVPAVLYALDSLTGQEVWSSASSLESFVHSGGLAAGGGRVYVSTYDGAQYAFGFPIEH